MDLQDSIDVVKSEVALRLGAEPLLRTDAHVYAYVLAGIRASVLAHVDNSLENSWMPDTATAAYLDRWCSLVGITRKSGAKATGTVAITGTNDAVFVAGSLLEDANSVKYKTTAAAVIVNGAATVAIEALDSVTITPNIYGKIITPTSGINTDCTITTDAGSNAESDEELRLRLKTKLATAPSGGTAGDYINWALSVNGVSAAWMGAEIAGTATVYIVENGVAASTQLLQDVKTYIDSVAPITAINLVKTPVFADAMISIGLNDATLRTAVETEIAGLFSRKYGESIIYNVEIAKAISNVADWYNLASPTGDLTIPTGVVFRPLITWI